MYLRVLVFYLLLLLFINFIYYSKTENVHPMKGSVRGVSHGNQIRPSNATQFSSEISKDTTK
jgi:hypothetical protein